MFTYLCVQELGVQSTSVTKQNLVKKCLNFNIYREILDERGGGGRLPTLKDKIFTNKFLDLENHLTLECLKIAANY